MIELSKTIISKIEKLTGYKTAKFIEPDKEKEIIDKIQKKECVDIKRRREFFAQRKNIDHKGKGESEISEDHKSNITDLVGLSLSGGGIRSATFNLGLLQALSRYNLLEKIDYLSTVSGGGYIGCCLTSLQNSDVNDYRKNVNGFNPEKNSLLDRKYFPFEIKTAKTEDFSPLALRTSN